MADNLSSRRIVAIRMSSVARNHVDKTYESTVCFQRTIRKAVALSFRRHPAPRVGCRFLRIVLVVTKCREHLPGRHAVRRCNPSPVLKEISQAPRNQHPMSGFRPSDVMKLLTLAERGCAHASRLAGGCHLKNS